MKKETIAICGECKYWTGDPENPNHSLHCSKYKKLQPEKTKKDKKPFGKKVEDAFAQKVKDIESIEGNNPVAGYTFGILKAVGIFVAFIIGAFIFMELFEFLGCNALFKCY